MKTPPALAYSSWFQVLAHFEFHEFTVLLNLNLKEKREEKKFKKIILTKIFAQSAQPL